MAFDDLFDFGDNEDSDGQTAPSSNDDRLPENAKPTMGKSPQGELAQSIVRTADRLGISPVDLATAISYETGGTFGKWHPGPTTQWGQHRGLIQWGQPQAKQYGVGPDTSISDQLDAVGRYLTDRGVKKGMGLLDVYSAINAGRVGLYDRSDANNGGAPGTVRDKVERQMGGHRAKAQALLAGLIDPEAVSAYAGAQAPAQAPVVQAINQAAGQTSPRAQMIAAIANAKASNAAKSWLTQVAGPEGSQDLPQPQMYGAQTVGAPTVPPVQMFGQDADDETLNGPAPVLDVAETPPVLPQGQFPEAQAQVPTAPPPVAPPSPQAQAQAQPIASPVPPDAAARLQALLPPPQKPTEQPSSVLNPDQGIQLQPPTPTAPQIDDTPTEGTAPGAGEALLNAIKPTAVEAGKQVQQMAQGALEAPSRMMYGLPMMAMAGPAIAENKVFGTNFLRSGVDWLAERIASDAGQYARVTQAGVPTTQGQKNARMIGGSISPNAKITAALVLGQGLADLLTPSQAAAEAPMDKKTAENLLFPPMVGPQLGPRVTHTINTAGGPATVGDGELSVMGILGATTLGAIFAPAIARKIASTALPALRDVPNAAPGTKSISSRIDLMRTYDDANAGLFRIARKAGVDPLVLKDIQEKFQIQTGSAARNLVNSAVTNGEMHTPLFSFKVNTPLSDLAQSDSDMLRQYLHAGDTFDDAAQLDARVLQMSPQQAKNFGYGTASGQPGPVQIRGTTMQDAIDMRNNLARAAQAQGIDLRGLGNAYRENVKEMRTFASRGEYGTISPKELQRLNAESSNYVPWQDESGSRTRVLTNGATDAERISPFDALKEEMHKTLKFRMENEAKGMYIDAMTDAMPELFTKITSKQYTQNPNWHANTVKIYRRGKPEYYTTDPFIADVLNRDPYAITGPIQQGLYATKRLAEAGATGVLAPWFSVTSMLRNWQIAKVSNLDGLSAPTLGGVVAAVPKQLVPKLANAISESLNNGSGGWVSSVLGPQAVQAISSKLSNVYANSLVARLETVGTHEGSFLQHQAQLNSGLQKAIDAAQGPARTFLQAYKNTLNALHNSAGFDYVSRNEGKMPLPQLAMKARDLTGDPQIGGAFYRDGKTPIRFDSGSDSLGSTALTTAAKGYGWLTEAGRTTVPWFNITTQGMKRIGQSYLDNPAKFVGKTYLYQMMPAAALFLYSRGAGVDPNGRLYSDYQMNGRGEYQKLMNWYIPIPGRPAEDGIEVPRFHELALPAHMMEVAMDHLTRSSVYANFEDALRAGFEMIGVNHTFPDQGGALFSTGEDLKTLGSSFYEAALSPPTPPVINAAFALQGFAAPQGMFGGGEVYKKKTDPYDQFGGMNATVELVARAFGTGIADVIGSGYAAYTNTPEGVAKAVGNAMTEGSKRAIMKTPIVRDLTDIKPPISGNNRITEELFKKEKVINNLSRYFRTWDESRGKGMINTKLASERGGQVVQNLLGPNPPSEPAGLNQPEPTNPLYKQFMQEVYSKFNNDSPEQKVGVGSGTPYHKKKGVEGQDFVWEPLPPEKAGIGYKSLWRRYGDYTAQLKRLRSVNEGNNVTWQRQLAGRPEQLRELQDNNVNPGDVRAVKNYYEKRRQDAVRQILFSIRAVEEDFSRRLGKPFHIEDLDPYGQSAGIPTPYGTIPGNSEIAQPTTMAPWMDGTGGTGPQ